MKTRKTLVLVVDDNPQNLQFLGKLLSDNGYEVGMGQSGPQALNFVKKNEPDLILLDIMMPEGWIMSPNPLIRRNFWPGSEPMWRLRS